MLELNISQAQEKIVVTLNELKTLSDPYFLFVFTHTETKQVVNIIRSTAQDESDYPYRYNQFAIATSVDFLNKAIGQWNYKVYEQVSDINTNPDNATGLIEEGKMILNGSVFEYEMYNEPTTYKTYNG